MIRTIPFNSETSLRITSRENTELPSHALLSYKSIEVIFRLSDSPTKQICEDRSASIEFLINEKYIAMLDNYVVTSLSAKSSEAQPFRTFYCKRAAMYKALN